MYEHQASTTPIASDHATTSPPLQGAAPKTAEPSSSTTGEAGKGKPKKGGKDKPKAKDGKGKAKRRKDKKEKKAKKAKLTASTADRHDLYQRSVNSPETDVDFTTKTFEVLRGRPARVLREDFYGTAALAAEFLGRDPANRAQGYDLDPEPVEWGRERNFSKVEDGVVFVDLA